MKNTVTIKNKINKFNKVIRVSGDKSLSIRWVLFASLASGKSKAKNLLLSTNSSVSEVAYILGFDYPQHFSKLFKLKTGYSPREFRKSS